MAKKAIKADKIVRRKVTKSLPCDLKEAEVLQYGRDLARHYSERERITSELAAVKEDYKAKIGEQAAAIGKLSARVHSGIETREVECLEVKNWTKASVSITRTDTNEAIESRPMREDEKQMEIAVEDAGVGEASGAEKA